MKTLVLTIIAFALFAAAVATDESFDTLGEMAPTKLRQGSKYKAHCQF